MDPEGKRKSSMKLGEVYFWTSTIFEWKHLLKADQFKQIIIDSLQTLYNRQKVKIYGFVIMPNHIHLLWEMLEPNGKELPNASFHKFTGHLFQKTLRLENNQELRNYQVNETERNYRFWQRDPLAFPVKSKLIAEQKLNYLHTNPLQEHWNLVSRPEHYHFSSARFYEGLSQPFNFITDYRDRF